MLRYIPTTYSFIKIQNIHAQKEAYLITYLPPCCDISLGKVGSHDSQDAPHGNCFSALHGSVWSLGCVVKK